MSHWPADVKRHIDDTRTVVLALAANEGSSRYGQRPTLILRCKSDTTELYINWNEYLGSEAKVLTRVGDLAARSQEWSLSTDHQATFYPGNDIAFIKELLPATRLVAQVTPSTNHPSRRCSI